MTLNLYCILVAPPMKNEQHENLAMYMQNYVTIHSSPRKNQNVIAVTWSGAAQTRNVKNNAINT